MERDTVEKRRAYRRKKAKQKRLIISFIFFGIIALSIVVALSLTVLFPVKKINFSGNKIYTEKQLEEGLELKGKNFFVLSEKKTVEEARKKLPYIKDIKITKKFPDTVSVKIIEAKDYAAYRVGSKYYMISDEGYVLAEKKSKPEDVIVIKAKGSKQTVGEKVKYPDNTSKEVIETVIEKLKQKDVKIDYIDVTSTTEITSGIMNGRFKVVFGTKQNIDKKIDHLCEMIKSIDATEKGTINLSSWTESDPIGRFIKE